MRKRTYTQLDKGEIHTGTYFTECDKEDIITSWSSLELDQGRQQAMERGQQCFVFPCTEKVAIKITLWFLRRFAMVSCTHYNGETLSLYCGDAGSGFWQLRTNVEYYVQGLMDGVI